MIKVNIKKDKIEIKGHAKFAEFGQDIVCAVVSSIVITTINGILRTDPESIEYQESNSKIVIKILKNVQKNELIINMLDLLNQLEKKYPKNIKIKQEV